MSVTIRIIDAEAAGHLVPQLCEILADCTDGGASVGFMTPLLAADATAYWEGVVDSVASGATILAGAFVGDRLVGTVQIGLASMPNQPHRADLKKLLVRSDARGKGIARLLMSAIEAQAMAIGRWLLVLDTATGSEAESIYPRLGWTRIGTIPDYALWPDGGLCSTTLFYKKLGG